MIAPRNLAKLLYVTVETFHRINKCHDLRPHLWGMPINDNQPRSLPHAVPRDADNASGCGDISSSVSRTQPVPARMEDRAQLRRGGNASNPIASASHFSLTLNHELGASE